MLMLTLFVPHTTVIGVDADLLIPLLHYATDNGDKLYYHSDNKIWINFQRSTYNHLISSSRERCKLLIFLHASTGCDTTSKFSTIEKSSKFVEPMKIQSCALSQYFF